MSADDRHAKVAAAEAAADRLASSIPLDVTYSCGSCGYMLNLRSCNRNTANIGSKYHKDIKKGIVSFFTVDESRFSRTDELFCKPFFTSKRSWGLFRRRTKLLCQKCGNHIGNAYNGHSSPGKSSNLDHISENGAFSRLYSIKISALQPSESGTLLLL